MRRSRVLLVAAALGVAMALGSSSVVLAQGIGQGCTQAMLNGLYMFTANGFIIPSSGPAQPKAIAELIRFNGDGTLAVPGAVRSLNGVIAEIPPGGTGTYTVADLEASERGCSGTLAFAPAGPHFDLFIPLEALVLWMFQTDANNVFQGTATLVAR